MKTSIFTRLFAGLLITSISLTAYSSNQTNGTNKSVPPVQETNNHYSKTRLFSDVLNQDLRVTYASHNGVDITEDMNDWTFRFNGSSPAGDAQGWNNILSSSGSWSMNEGSEMISIAFPSTLPQLAFMSQTWTIGTAGKGAEVVFTSSNGDEVHFLSNVQ